MEMSPFPELALRAGDRLRDLVPESGHLIHMPTHIDVLCGNYRDVVVYNQKASVADRKYLEREGDRDAFEGTAIVFEGPEDYHHRINDPKLPIDENSILFIRNVGPVGYPGAAEVVNMLPPDRLVKGGVLVISADDEIVHTFYEDAGQGIPADDAEQIVRAAKKLAAQPSAAVG